VEGFRAGGGGTYLPGSFTRSDRLIVPSDAGRIFVDVFSRQGSPVVTFTRFRVAYLATGDFAFSVHHTDARDAFARVFGRGKDIAGADPIFDGNFVVRGSEEDAVRALFASDDLRRRGGFPPFRRAALRSLLPFISFRSGCTTTSSSHRSSRTTWSC